MLAEAAGARLAGMIVAERLLRPWSKATGRVLGAVVHGRVANANVARQASTAPRISVGTRQGLRSKLGSAASALPLPTTPALAIILDILRPQIRAR